MNLPTAAFSALLAGAPILGACRAAGLGGESHPPPAPVPVRNILAASRFTLQTPFEYSWSAERRTVSTGVLVVLEVDRQYVVPRDEREPVLYAGDVPVQRLNHGDLSGRVIGIVPGNVDLATTPIWFGTPELPERVTASMAKKERARAEESGVRAFPAERIEAVQRPPVAATDLASLLRTAAATLLDEFSPQEKELSDSWRLPVAKAPPRR